MCNVATMSTGGSSWNTFRDCDHDRGGLFFFEGPTCSSILLSKMTVSASFRAFMKYCWAKISKPEHDNNNVGWCVDIGLHTHQWMRSEQRWPPVVFHCVHPALSFQTGVNPQYLSQSSHWSWSWEGCVGSCWRCLLAAPVVPWWWWWWPWCPVSWLLSPTDRDRDSCSPRLHHRTHHTAPRCSRGDTGQVTSLLLCSHGSFSGSERIPNSLYRQFLF